MKSADREIGGVCVCSSRILWFLRDLSGHKLLPAEDAKKHRDNGGDIFPHAGFN
jgi:hypothetical protein